MIVFEKLLGTAKPIVDLLISPSSVFSLYSLAFALFLGVAFLAIRQKRRRGRLRLRAIARAIFARRVLFHRSTLADFGYFLIGVVILGALLGWALFSATAISDAVSGFMQARLGARTPFAAPDFVLRAGMTIVLFLAYELGYFVDHSLKHRIPALWELHKTHHTAEVLTPLTNFRVHPLDSLMFANVLAVVIGVCGGLAKYLIGKPVAIFAFDGTNILMVAYIYFAAHLQHSQIWIPLRGPLGRIFISPAHHQIHHSSDPAHFNRNMGASLAIWDWLFGTLEIPPQHSPGMKFGVRETDAARADPHSVTALVLDPVVLSLGTLFRSKRPSVRVAASRVETKPTMGL
jgi:sterol desaturase/sphingolipid hydroxylase (fatty acid hydroxylase superfamily)